MKRFAIAIMVALVCTFAMPVLAFADEPATAASSSASAAENPLTPEQMAQIVRDVQEEQNRENHEAPFPWIALGTVVVISAVYFGTRHLNPYTLLGVDKAEKEAYKAAKKAEKK